MRKRVVRYFVVAITALLLSGQALADVSGTAIVVDGDTLSIAGIKVRLNGIDTPEKDQTCKANGLTYSCGYDATEAVRKWTYTKEVRCVGDQTDRYGRLIADCYVSGYNLNARIVYEGLGLAYRQYSKKYVPEEDQAREARRGVWAGEFVAPWDWRKGKRLEEQSGQQAAPLSCCKICTTGKACGDACISKSYSCNVGPGCACNG